MKPQPDDRLVPLWSQGVKFAPSTASPPDGPAALPHQLCVASWPPVALPS